MAQNIEKVTDKNRGAEQQGTKKKFWFGEKQDKLFKIGRDGEDWAEIVAFHLAVLLEIPCANYTPASFNGKHGVVSESFIDKSKGDQLIHANELLANMIRNYEQEKKYKQRNYTLSVSIALIRWLIQSGELKTLNPTKQFIGYLIFDSWIGNQDRHHENWGFIAKNNELYLAPSFDHASSMGCRVGDDEKQQRLETNDRGYCVKAFAKQAKTAMYSDEGKLSTYALATLCYKHYPEEYKFWVNKINKVTETQIKECFNLLSEKRMNDINRQFTLKLLQANQQFLLSLCVKN